MNLTNNYVSPTGIEYTFEYSDTNSFDDLPQDRCKQCYAVCFYEDQVVIGYTGGAKKSWGLIGGTIEKGEAFEQTLLREIQEESNMEILSFLPIGYQKVTDSLDSEPFYQLRYVCLVRPLGPFISDPADSITEIKLIDPTKYKDYFDWGNIGDRIIERAIELKSDLS